MIEPQRRYADQQQGTQDDPKQPKAPGVGAFESRDRHKDSLPEDRIGAVAPTQRDEGTDVAD
jgi:hypothetical protein